MKKNSNKTFSNLKGLVREINKRDAKLEEKLKHKNTKKQAKFMKKFCVKIIKHIISKKSGFYFYIPAFIDANQILYFLMKNSVFEDISFSIDYYENIGMNYIKWYVLEGV